MADISKVILDNTQYNIKDTIARNDIDTLESSMAELDSHFSDLSDEVSEYSSDVEALDTLVQANTQDISTLQSSVATNTSNISTLQDYDGLVRIPYSASDFNYNFLLWSPSNPTRIYHKRAKFGWTAATKSQYSNIPTKLASENVAYGVREFYYADSSNALVKVTEFYPVAGRVHINAYVGSAWAGWQCIDTSTHGVDLTNSYQIVTGTGSVGSIAAGGSGGISITVTVPSGYTAVGVAGVDIQNTQIALAYCYLSTQVSNQVRVGFYNPTSSSYNAGTATVNVLCLRTS